MLAIIAGLLGFGNSAKADQGNQLANPGFETGDDTGWVTQGPANVHSAADTYYNAGMCPADPTAEHINVYDGTYVGNLYGTFSAAISYSFYQQTLPTVAGSTWSASCWAYASHEDLMGGNNFVVDVAFLDASSAVIREYQSVNVTNLTCNGANVFPLDTWVQLLVTNQVQNGVVIGTVPSGVFAAPPGTASVRYQLLFENVNYDGGSIYFDDAVLDLVSGPIVVPPVISSLTPSNAIVCTNGFLTYTVTSSAGTITNVQVVATMTGLPGSGAASNTVTYTPTSGLNVTGLGTTTANVSLALNSNTLYNVTVSGVDNSGVIVTLADFFDTLQPVYLFEAEDFNYSGGQWITSITPDGGLWAYANLVGTEAIDEHDGDPGNGVHHYRASDPVSVQGAAEVSPAGVPINRQKYLNDYAVNPADSTNPDTQDEEVGYVNTGDWQDYTRNFPTGKYNVYARLAVSGASLLNFQQVLTDPTQSGQTVTNLGTFSITDNNWNLYQYCPLLDQYGNMVSVSLGGTQTVRVLVGAGSGPNENFFMIVPAVVAQTPVLQASYPDGLHPFEPTNHFTFTVGQGAGSTIPAGNVHLALNGSDVTAQVSFSSTATNWTGTISVVSNTSYSAIITVTNSTHLSSAYTISFDTFSQNNFMVEAEDFDFENGTYIDNPQPTGDSTISGGVATGTSQADSYYGYPGGVVGNVGFSGVDWFSTESGQSEQYRPFDVPGTQVCGDYLRQKFIDSGVTLSDPNVADFNIGWYSTGTWLNYTRHYPAGNYYVYGRMAGGGGAFSGTTLSLITGGWGTASQSTNILGGFADPNASGWQTWHWVPMLDANSNLVTVAFTGSTNTLRLTSGNNLNVNFLMLVPATTPLLPLGLTISHTGSQISISFATQAGHAYTVLYSSSLNSGAVWSTLTTVNGNGNTQTVTDTISGAARFYRVSAQ
jgi:hypothetical protein